MRRPELVMVDFGRSGADLVQMVAPIVDELATEYAGKLKVRKLNTDENPEIAGRYQAMSIPDHFVLQERPNGRTALGCTPEAPVQRVESDSLLAQHSGAASLRLSAAC